MTNVLIENIASDSHGTIINTNQNNILTIISMNIVNAYSYDKGIIFLFNNCSLNLIDTSFVNIVSKNQVAFIYASLAEIFIQGCILQNVSSFEIGLIYLNHSNLKIESVKIEGVSVIQGISGISALNSNISIYNTFMTKFLQLQSASSEEFLNYMISLQNNNKKYNWVLIRNNTFQNNGLNSNSLFYLSTIQNISIDLNHFIDNSNCRRLIMINEISILNILDLTLVNNYLSTSAIEIINYDENLVIASCVIANVIFMNNFVSESLLLIQGNIELLFHNVSVVTNTKTSSEENLFEMSYLSKSNLGFWNFSNTSGSSGKEYLLHLFNCSELFLSDFEITHNKLQFLKIEYTTIEIIFIKALNIYVFSWISIKDSFFFMRNSFFQGSDNSKNFCNTDLNCNTTTIFIFNSTITLMNLSFIDIQIENIYPQYYIASFECDKIDLKQLSFINPIYQAIYMKNIINLIISSSNFEISNLGLKNYTNSQFEGLYLENYNDNIDYNLTVLDSNFRNLGSNKSDSSFYYNSISIKNSSSNILVSNCTFLNNTAKLGGAIFLQGLTNSVIKNSKFIYNEAIVTLSSNTLADSGLGGSIYTNFNSR